LVYWLVGIVERKMLVMVKKDLGKKDLSRILFCGIQNPGGGRRAGRGGRGLNNQAVGW
jgi:hypothetical protein